MSTYQVYEQVAKEMWKLPIDGFNNKITPESIELNVKLLNGTRVQVLAVYDGNVDGTVEAILDQIKLIFKQ